VKKFWGGVHLVKAMFVTFYCISLPKLLMSIPLMLVIGNLELEDVRGAHMHHSKNTIGLTHLEVIY